MSAAARRLVPFVLLTPFLLGTGCPTGSTNIRGTFPHSLVWPPILINRAANTFPTAAVVADLNSDGLTDVIVGYPGGNGATAEIIAFIQVAPAQWGAVPILRGDALTGLSSLAVGDIDGDSLPDIIAGCQSQIIYLRSPPNPLSGVGWLADTINGSVDSNLGRWTDVAIVQLDKLFGPDIVACNASPGQLSWFRAPQVAVNGSQWQRLDIDATTRTGASSFILQDLDRDGNLDLLSSAKDEAAATLAWYRHPGGNIVPNAAWTKFPIGSLAGATHIDIGDFNRDGMIDVVVASPAEKRVGWYAQPSDLLNGTWTGFVLAEFTANTPVDVRVNDLDVNAQPDVVVATADAGTLRWFTPVNEVRARWVENNMADIGENVSRIALADIDRNGRTDVITTLISTDPAQDAVAWYRNPEP